MSDSDPSVQTPPSAPADAPTDAPDASADASNVPAAEPDAPTPAGGPPPTPPADETTTAPPPEADTSKADASEADAPEGSSSGGSSAEGDDLPAPEDVADPAAALAEARAELERLRAQHEETNNRLLRTAAELQNYRKRVEREKARLYDSGRIDVVRRMLDVLDDFERSLDAAALIEEKQDAEAAFQSLKGGVEMVFQKFMDELAQLGVEPLDAEGEPFDEQEHEALMQQAAPEGVAPGTVLSEVRKGYRLDDRIVRYSRVIVASE